MLVRIFNYFMLATIIVAIYGLFTIKDKVASLHFQLEGISKQIKLEHDAIHLLKAEFAYLSSPLRLRQLASHYLGLENIKTSQMVRDPLVPENRYGAKSKDSYFKLTNANTNWRYKKIVNNKYIQTVSSRKME